MSSSRRQCRGAPHDNSRLAKLRPLLNQMAAHSEIDHMCEIPKTEINRASKMNDGFTALLLNTSADSRVLHTNVGHYAIEDRARLFDGCLIWVKQHPTVPLTTLANLYAIFRLRDFANRLSSGAPSTSLLALGYLDFTKACFPGPVADILIPGPISGSGGASLHIRMPTTRVNQKLSRLIPFSVAQQFLAQRI